MEVQKLNHSKKVIYFMSFVENPREFDFDGHHFLGQFETNNNGFFDWLRAGVMALVKS